VFGLMATAIIIASTISLLRQANERKWRALARDLGLTLWREGSKPLLTGRWDGFRVSLRFPFESGSPVKKTWWMDMTD